MNSNRLGINPEIFWLLHYAFFQRFMDYGFFTLAFSVFNTKLSPLDFAATAYALLSTLSNI